MPGKSISSVDVSVLDSKITADACEGKFFISAEPTIFATDRADDIGGIKIKIVNPASIVIKDYSDSFDIAAPATEVFDFPIPTQAGNFQYGRYIVYLQLTDSGGKVFEMDKPVFVSHPDPNNKMRKFGCISASIKGVCNQKKVVVRIGDPPVYRGKVAESTTQSFTFEFPTGGPEPIEFTNLVFSHSLYEGEYRVRGEMCATFNAGDNIYYKIKYKLNVTKKVLCQIDLCCVYAKLSDFAESMRGDCTEQEKWSTFNKTLHTIRLLETANLANQCGEDASEWIDELEVLLGCKCTCNCDDPTNAYVPGSATGGSDIVIEGCGVEESQSGLTKVYTIQNHTFVVSVNQNDNVLTVGSAVPDEENCTITYPITFDTSKLYDKVKALAKSTASEANEWASVVNKSLNDLEVSGLGVSTSAWAALTLAGKTQKIIDKINACCNCGALIVTHSVSNVGGINAKVVWSSSGAYGVDIYLDNTFVDRVLSPVSEYTMNGVANGSTRTYKLIPVCEGGSSGTAVTGTFNYVGCPVIAAPNLSSNTVSNAACPFDLNSLLSPLPAGITAEWHTANNTNASTLVPDPTSVIGGVFYVFGKDASGCYSPSNSVQVMCSSSSCTAPQGLNVTYTNSGYRVRFQSASNPPPLNSYTVKRRLASDPDIPASYTTIGTPVWNASANVWEIFDNSGIPSNVRHTYAAVSNCGSTQPTVYFSITHCAPLTGVSVSVVPQGLSVSFDIPTQQPASGYRIRYRAGGSGAYMTHNAPSPATLPIIVNIDNPYQNWDGFVEASCGETGYSESVSFTASGAIPRQNLNVILSVVSGGGSAGVEITLDDNQSVEDSVQISGTIVAQNPSVTSRQFTATIPVGQTTVMEHEVFSDGEGYSDFSIDPSSVVITPWSSKDSDANVVFDFVVVVL